MLLNLDIYVYAMYLVNKSVIINAICMALWALPNVMGVSMRLIMWMYFLLLSLSLSLPLSLSLSLQFQITVHMQLQLSNEPLGILWIILTQQSCAFTIENFILNWFDGIVRIIPLLGMLKWNVKFSTNYILGGNSRLEMKMRTERGVKARLVNWTEKCP